MSSVAIGLGTNLGDREGNMRTALENLGAVIQIEKISSLIETPALLKQGAPEEWNKPFLNAVCIGSTQFSPEELLNALQHIEQQMGRHKEGVWSPRIIDLDILLYENEVISELNLVIPHPEMLKRDFVMRPLCEVAPDWLHPKYQKTITELWHG